MNLYIVHCVLTDKYYVGQTKRTLHWRWYFHIREALNEKHKASRSHFHAAIRKYGHAAFEPTLIADNITSIDKLNEMEKLWIWVLRANDPTFGYNIGVGGEGVTLTSEVREKMRLAKLGKTWNRGKKRTAEARAKMSASHRGQVPWNKGLKKISQS